jgi:hypothetical protein
VFDLQVTHSCGLPLVQQAGDAGAVVRCGQLPIILWDLAQPAAAATPA